MEGDSSRRKLDKRVRHERMTLGVNLTLTGYNSTYSDRPFESKKTIKGGFSESSVRLNKFVREQDQWTPREIGRRGRRLAGRWSACAPRDSRQVAPIVCEAHAVWRFTYAD
jgi:Protein of unknown function (DUF1524)